MIKIIQQGKTNWIFIVIVVTVAGALGGGLIAYINDTIRQTTELPQVSELKKLDKTSKPGISSAVLKQNNELSAPTSSDDGYRPIDQKKYPQIELDAAVEQKIIDYVSKSERLDEFDDIDMARQIKGTIKANIYGFYYQGATFIIVSGPFNVPQFFVFKLDKDNELKSLGDFGAEYQVIEKDGKLYIATAGKIGGYCGSSAATPSWRMYYLIDSDGLKGANENFREIFVNDAIEAEKELQASDDYKENKQASFLGGHTIGCLRLIEMTADYLIVGEATTAWEKFDVYFSRLYQSSTMDASGLKQIIIDSTKGDDLQNQAL